MNITVFVKEPGKAPEARRIPNELASLQEIVGGWIETMTVGSDIVVICNEEGRLLGLPYNCKICGLDIFGTIILAGVKGENFADVYSKERLRYLLPHLWNPDYFGTKTCVLCGKAFNGFGNNPWPLAESGECCDKCNLERVVPARIEVANGRQAAQRAEGEDLTPAGEKRTATVEWYRPEEKLPKDDIVLLGVVTAESKNVSFVDAMELLSYDSDSGNWILEGYPAVRDVKVSWWCELPVVPDLPEEDA